MELIHAIKSEKSTSAFNAFRAEKKKPYCKIEVNATAL